MSSPYSNTPSGDATPADELLTALRELTRSLRASVDERLEPLGLSQAQWRPLLALHKSGGPLSQTELARLLEIEAPSLVRLLDRLAENHWIERRSTPHDRRVRLVHLTDSAGSLMQRILPLVHQVKEQAIGGIGADEISACLATLLKIRDNLRGPPEPS